VALSELVMAGVPMQCVLKESSQLCILLAGPDLFYLIATLGYGTST
jgi:hypothetical protein